MEFRCRLATATGQVSEGTFVADSEAALRRELEEKGLYVLDLRAARRGFPGLTRSRGGRIKQHEFLVFNQELATLLKAGMPLVQSLEILRRNIPNPTFKALLDDVYDKVRSGTALSDAFEAHPRHVNPIYTASLMAGERSGSLEQVLRRYVSYVQVISAVQRRVVSALVYPAVLTLLSFAVVAIIVVRVVPEFNEFYKGFNAQLPLATRVIVAVSATIRGQILLIALAMAGLVIGARWALRQPEQRRRLDRLVLGLPGLGDHRPPVRDLAAGADAGHAPWRRHPAGDGARRRQPLGLQPTHRRADGRHHAAGAGRAAPVGGNGRQGRVS